jgi:hypothetical protein
MSGDLARMGGGVFNSSTIDILLSRRSRHNRIAEQVAAFASNDEGQSGKKQKGENDASKRDLVDAAKHDDAKCRSCCQRR